MIVQAFPGFISLQGRAGVELAGSVLELSWAPNWRVYDAAGLKAELEKWRLPSTYVMEGEAPEHALSRIMLDQLGVKVYSVRSSSLQNFYEPSRRSPGEMHWDYCFVFSVSIHEEVKESRWLYGPRYVKPSDADVEYGSAQGGLLTRLAPPPDA